MVPAFSPDFCKVHSRVSTVRVLTTEQVLEKRAEKRVAESDNLLLIAILRIWKAHTNGRLLEQIRSRRLKALALKRWKDKLNVYRADEGGSRDGPCLLVY